ncbi:LacI family DNA-binding transcriptional regulator [Nocardiopsis sp. MG754419]|uniref:LacI family DNA-binding transcriptional regulator n=1 Tax=Nocardiopsis sp. MG754419 TaxID=2259865 RepID=UPI001BAE3AD0|nr:LacI family DNA-binding transcriptional regulator [Nocardiopsis sp. MG754419]MBR8744089.1 LacI family transcriptional regulator [Nocardiopsis sp. MG754419]
MRSTRTRVSSDGPTLTDVATRAGVSLATASRVLNGSNRKVGQVNRDRVLRAARELDYRPDLPAQTMARGTAPVVALLVSTIDDPYFSAIASGVAESADAHGMTVTIAITARDSALELSSVRLLRSQRPRAILLCGSRTTNDPHTGALLTEMRRFTAHGGRAVFIGQSEGGLNAVCLDNVAGACGLGAELAGLGYRRAAVITGSERMRTAQERLQGLASALTGSGATVALVERDTFDRTGGYRCTRRLIDSGRLGEVDVVCAGNDVMAIGAMTALREAGIRPGRDIAVTGFNDIDTAADVTPKLTTVRFPLADLGRRATDLALAPGDPAVGDLLVEGHVVLRDSSPRLR